MPISVIDTEISEVKLIIAVRHPDNRGFFSETYKEIDYEKIGIPEFVQDNLSESAKGVIRGLHWQDSPFGQGKLVTCFTGAIFDVAVDIRKNSSTFGKHVAMKLNSSEPKALWIPEGFAHGFQSLEDNTRVMYKVTNYWNKDSEKSLNYCSPGLNIVWPIRNPILSEKDREAVSLNEIHVD